MGFRAPSAEDVYRYVMRWDDKPRSLTDGFGWSILMVGDYSDVCRKFLLDHCLDLCARTADRVRFVFFSELPVSKFEQSAQTHLSPPEMLAEVLNTIRSDALRLDFERGPWRLLRPLAFEPLTDEKDILQQLTFDKKHLTAVPGAGESLRFAQRLGIGRHVPCLLMFTDVADTPLHVLPFARRTAYEVYAHVRAWIDEYYEENQAALALWGQVENEIIQLSDRISHSLHMVRDWPEKQRRKWIVLRKLAAYAAAPPTTSTDFSPVLSDNSLPFHMRHALCDVRDQLARIEQHIDRRQQLSDFADKLANETDVQAIRAILRSIKTIGVSQETRAALSTPFLDKQQSITQWRKNTAAAFSKRMFRTARTSWLAIASTVRLDSETGAEHRNRDYAAFRTTVDVQRFGAPPQDTADAILAALAAHYGLEPSRPEWTEATSEFRRSLISSVADLQRTVPDSAPELIGDCFPGTSWPTTVPDERQDRMLRLRDLSVEALSIEVRQLATMETDHAAILATLSTILAGFRREAEENVLTEPSLPVTDPADVKQIANLAAALEIYDNAVRSVIYPHQYDPATIQVRNRGLARATGLQHASTSSRIDFLRSLSNDAMVKHQTALREWESAERADNLTNPVGVLTAAIDAEVSSSRRHALGDVATAVHQGRAAELLAQLTPTELRQVASRLRIKIQPIEQGVPAVLTALGLGPDLPVSLEDMKRLQEKIKSNEFDVFMAHHSSDKPLVLELCQLLRQRGIHPWVDIDRIRPGTFFQDALQSAIRTVRSAAMCIGPAGLGRWQAVELKALTDRCATEGIPLIPVLLPGVTQLPEDLIFLRQLNYVQFVSVSDDEPLRRLIWGITGKQA